MSSSYGQLLKDMRAGYEDGEKPVKEFLQTQFGIIADPVDEKFTYWDLEVSSADESFLAAQKISVNPEKFLHRFVNKYGKTFEIKRDFASDKTGNFFFECFSNIDTQNPGCLQQSKADTLIIVMKGEFIFVNRAHLLSWIIFNIYSETDLGIVWKKKTCRRVKKPDMRNSRASPKVRGILIPIEHIKGALNVEVFKR